MDDEDPLDLLARWLTDQRAAIDIPGQVAVRETTGAYGRRTTVVIDHLLPEEEGREPGRRRQALAGCRAAR